MFHLGLPFHSSSSWGRRAGLWGAGADAAGNPVLPPRRSKRPGARGPAQNRPQCPPNRRLVKKSGPSRFSPAVALNSTAYYCRSCTADYAVRYLELRTAQETSWLPGFQLLPPYACAALKPPFPGGSNVYYGVLRSCEQQA